MKILLIIILTSISLFAQNFVKIKDANTNKDMLLGVTTEKAYQDTSFSKWYNFEYNSYTIDTNLVNEYKSKIIDKKITVVLGTWCPDSKREVPRFFKILDYLNFPNDSLKIINVDREKHALDNEVEDLDIELVPTIIVYDKNEEIGRIVESPEESLEQDLVKIVTED